MLATGTYVGDSTDDRTINTGLTGTIRHVRVNRCDGGGQPLHKEDTYPGKAVVQEGTCNPISNMIAFAGANFVVDAGVNAAGHTYYWIAFSTNP